MTRTGVLVRKVIHREQIFLVGIFDEFHQNRSQTGVRLPKQHVWWSGVVLCRQVPAESPTKTEGGEGDSPSQAAWMWAFVRVFVVHN
jgi:hypothetical protein